MKSMTGFAYLEERVNDTDYTIEIKSYNSRYLEVSVNIPQDFSGCESEVRSLAASCCRRGKIEINIGVKQHDGRMPYTFNADMLSAYIELCGRLRPLLRRAGFKPVRTINILDFMCSEDTAGNTHQTPSPVPAEKFAAMKAILQKALERFNRTREHEGESTKQSIMQFLGNTEAALNIIKSHSTGIEDDIKANIKKRIAELGISGIDDNRMQAEIAFLLMKWTIAEEVSRLESHIALFKDEADNNPAPGKKLDFLAQEMMREVNTIGSKTPKAEVSCLVVSMKENIENIREQLRNIE